MKCKKARILCQELLDGELHPKQKELLFAHLSTCSECMKFYKDSKKLKRLIASISTPPLSPTFNFFVWQKIKESDKKTLRPIPIYQLARKALFLVIPLIFLVFLLFTIPRGKAVEEELFNSYSKEHFVYTLKNPLISTDSAIRILLVSGEK